MSSSVVAGSSERDPALGTTGSSSRTRRRQKLSDVSGKVLISSKLENTRMKQEFSASALSSGIYFYRINCNSFLMKKDKIVVVK